ncbi:aminopeptidase [Haliovirga abyssi]|uniref:M18 family aminopeptidase n=1 Tax=Haliovirga abyssi TaxID=2996794 RepID=A0AAU9DA14_9FUSO|nr:aminopeptidase [Haliovirga abyssi]BDU51483.1 putative M18 family aminopeptidase 1 [Haliovirga abyssi]
MRLKKENGWKNMAEEKKKEIFEFSNGYKKFLNDSKTEREFVRNGIKVAEENGFVNAENVEKLKAGDKIYYVNREKNLVLVIVGEEEVEKGVNFVVSHIDSPRLDLKQNPLFEDTEFALLRTHYYGGVKKYQWVSIPLALHGTVILEDGKKVDLAIGEDDNDPIFTIPDILPHLSKNAQDDRKAREVIKGEELQLVVGSIPTSIEDKEVKDKVKQAILEKLNSDYGMKEEDFISAEFEVVPAFKAKDLGFDRSMIAGYGHDDRICGYTSLKAILEIEKTPKHTAVCYLADKEEIGSTGSTGLESRYLEFFMSDIMYKLKDNYNDYFLRKCLWNSYALSSDVNGGINPIFKSVHEEQNASKLGYGIVMTKYTGHGGKGASNDADAEYVGMLRKMLNDAGIKWQTGMLGKIDEGGGGTVAKYLAHFGIHTIDAGPALLAMHSPYEVASKFDLFETYRTYKVFYER